MTPDNSVLQLTALLLAKEITPELLETLQNPTVRDLLTGIEPEVENLLTRQWTEQDYEDAAVEFCRLFILEPAVPARAAAWLEDKPDQIAARIQFMIDQGLLLLPPPFDTLTPDHLAVLLITQSSLGENNHDGQEDDGQFWADNLAPWLPRFATALHQKSTSPLYRLVGKLLTS